MKKRIGVLTSGGDAPGMNAAVRAVVRGSIYNDMQVCGIYNGYEGLMSGDIEEFGLSSVADIIHRGGTMLKTARSPRFMTEEGLNDALKQIKLFGLDALVIVGGDGSFRGGLSLQKKGVDVIGIPATIDNDLAYTDFTIGFDTAANTIISLLGNIRDTSASHGRATVVEVMGRHCGDLALHAGLAAGAESILIPEDDYNLDAVCEKMLAGKKRGKLQSIIIKAEGVDIGVEELAKILEDRTGIPTKTVVPGYIQRGGSPSVKDRLLAAELAYSAITLLKERVSGKAVGVSGRGLVNVDLEKAVSERRKRTGHYRRIAAILSI